MKFNQSKFNKKGQAGMSTAIAALIGIAVIFGSYILITTILTDVIGEIKTSNLANDNATTITNETVTWTNGTTVTLVHFGGPVASLTCGSVRQGANQNLSGTTNNTIQPGNYSCDNSGFFFNNNPDKYPAGFNISRTFNVTYTYKDAGAEYNTSQNGITGQLKLADQSGNMGTVIAVIALITILMAGFAAVMRRGS